MSAPNTVPDGEFRRPALCSERSLELAFGAPPPREEQAAGELDDDHQREHARKPAGAASRAVGGDERAGCLLYTSPSPRD